MLARSHLKSSKFLDKLSILENMKMLEIKENILKNLWSFTITGKRYNPTCKKAFGRDQDGDWSGPLDIYAANEAGDPISLKKLFEDSEFVRLFIWPQLKPALVTVWKAKIAHKDSDGEYIDYDKEEWKEIFQPHNAGRSQGLSAFSLYSLIFKKLVFAKTF